MSQKPPVGCCDKAKHGQPGIAEDLETGRHARKQ